MHIYSFWLNTNRKKFIFCQLLFENLPLKKLVLVARNNEKVFHCRHFLHLFCRFLWKKTANWCISLYFRAEISHLFRAYERSNVFLLPPPPPPPRVRQRLGTLGNGSFIIKFFSFMRAQLIFDSKVVLSSFVLDVLIWTNPPPCPGLKAWKRRDFMRPWTTNITK